MTDSGVVYTATDATPVSTPEPGMLRQVLAYNPQLMMVRHNFKKWNLRAGDSVVVDGSLDHQASALEDSEVLDIFTPYREDYA